MKKLTAIQRHAIERSARGFDFSFADHDATWRDMGNGALGVTTWGSSGFARFILAAASALGTETAFELFGEAQLSNFGMSTVYYFPHTTSDLTK